VAEAPRAKVLFAWPDGRCVLEWRRHARAFERAAQVDVMRGDLLVATLDLQGVNLDDGVVTVAPAKGKRLDVRRDDHLRPRGEAPRG
jgi:hypothetical protein